METRILQMIEVLESRLEEYRAEYKKYVELDSEKSNWTTVNSRGFYNGLITAAQIEIGQLQELLCLNATLGGK